MADDTEKTAEEIARAAEAAGIAADKINEFKEGMKEAATQAEAINNLFEQLNTASESSVGTTAERLDQDRERIRLASQLIDLASRTGQVESDTLSTMRETVGERKRINALLVNEERLIEKAKTKLIGYKEETLSIKYHLMAIGDIWTNMGSQEALSRVINKAATAMFSFANAIFQASIEFDKVAASVAKATSTTQFKGAMEDLRTEALSTGVSVEQLGQNFITLNNNFTDFNRLDAEAAKQLASTATALNAANFSAESFAKTLDLGTKALGMSREQVQTFSLELVNFGKSAGIPLDRLSKNLDSSGSKLVEFGVNGEKVFKELALASKNLGIEMDRMFNIAEQYTTFEGAAGAAAKLNSVLGGNFVNSLDLMNTALENPTDTFRLLKNSMDASGKSFGDMTPAMKKVIAEAAGFNDISEAARVFNMDVDEASEYLEEQAIKQEELNKMNREFMGFQEKINKLLAQMIPIVTPIIDWMSNMIDKIAEFAKENEILFKSLGWVTAIIVGGALVVKFFLVMAANTVLVTKAIFGLGAAFATVFRLLGAGPTAIYRLIRAKLALRKATDEQRKAEEEARKERERSSKDSSFERKVKAIADAAKGAWKEMLAFGGAIALIGVGIAAAAFGMSYLVESFKEVGDNAWAAVAAIGVLGLTFVGLIISFAFAIKIMGAAALMAAPGILALGGAIALIGLGIGLAAAGMSLFVSAFGQLSKEQIEGAANGLIIFAVSLGLLIPLLAGLSAPTSWIGVAILVAIGAAAMAIGYGMNLASEGISKIISNISQLMEKSKDFNTSLSDLGNASGAYIGVAQSFGEMVNAVELLDTNKLSAISSLSSDLSNMASYDFSNIISLAGAINSIDIDKLNNISNANLNANISPTKIEKELPVIQVQEIIVNKSIKTEDGQQIGQKGITNINLEVPVKIDGADFRDVVVGIVKEQIRANSDNGASINTRTE
jgi:hypothetical protein